MTKLEIFFIGLDRNYWVRFQGCNNSSFLKLYSAKCKKGIYCTNLNLNNKAGTLKKNHVSFI